MPALSSTLLKPPWFFLLFVALWLGLSGLLSYLSGWRRLAARFRATKELEGERFRFASGAIGSSTCLPVSYRGCLLFTVGSAGFRLALAFPFRFLSPPLFIPWAQVESVTERRHWFVRHAIVHLRGYTTRIMVPGRAGQSITQAYARDSSAPGP
ncbi:MAG: hypothetical protein ACYDDA_12090 [Acidiferrobacteraceae bacterium]